MDDPIALETDRQVLEPARQLLELNWRATEQMRLERQRLHNGLERGTPLLERQRLHNGLERGTPLLERYNKREFSRHRRHILKKEVVAVADGGGEDAPLLCAICIEELAVKSEAAVLECNHKFHKECIMKWLDEMNKNTCPLCRSEVSEVSE